MTVDMKQVKAWERMLELAEKNPLGRPSKDVLCNADRADDEAPEAIRTMAKWLREQEEALSKLTRLMDLRFGRWGAYKSALIEEFGFEGRSRITDEMILREIAKALGRE